MFIVIDWNALSGIGSESRYGENFSAGRVNSLVVETRIDLSHGQRLGPGGRQGKARPGQGRNDPHSERKANERSLSSIKRIGASGDSFASFANPGGRRNLWGDV